MRRRLTALRERLSARALLDRIDGWGLGRSLAVRARPVTSVVSRGALVVAVLGVAAWIAAVRLDWVEAAWVAVACAGVLVVSVLFLLRRAEVSAVMVLDRQRVTVGDAAGGHITIRNLGRRRSPAVQVELAVGRRRTAFDVPGLAAGEETSEEFIIPTHRRQIIPVGPVACVQGDPLGFVRRSSEWGEAVPVYVHPRIARLEELGAGFLRDLEGQPTVDLSTNDIAFHALREYQPGDDRRFVHWRTTARTGTLMVRQFLDTRRSHLGIILDTQRAGYEDDDEFELAISLAASLAVRAMLDEQQVTLITGEGIVRSSDGRSLLDALSGIRLRTRDSDMTESAARLSRMASGVSTVTLVTGSQRGVTDLRAAARRAGEGLRCMAVRATPGATTSIQIVDGMTMVGVPRLEEFGHAFWTVSRW